MLIKKKIFFRNGFVVEVSEDLNNMLQQASDDLSVPIKNPVTKLFTSIGFDTFHFGSTSANTGSLIGIPISFFYKSAFDIDKSSIQVSLV